MRPLHYLKAIIILLIGCLLLSSNVFGKGILFAQGNWIQIQQQARKQQKPIFVEVYVDGCKLCKKMEQEVFTTKEVSNYYNDHFVNYKININTREGKNFKQTYQVNETPNLLYFDATGTLLYRDAGNRNPNELIEIGRTAKRKVVITLESMLRQYQNGFRKANFLYDFAYMLKKNKQAHQQVVKEYLEKKKIKKSSKKTEKDLTFIYDFATHSKSPAFKLLLNTKEEFEKKYGIEHINSKIRQVFIQDASVIAANHQEKMFKQLYKMAKKVDFPDQASFLLKLKSIYYTTAEQKQRKKEVEHTALENNKQALLLYQKAQKLIHNSNKKRDLQQAKQLLQESITLSNQYANHETYVYLLYRLGERSEMIKIAQKALEIAENQSLDALALKRFLQKINVQIPPTKPASSQFINYQGGAVKL